MIAAFSRVRNISQVAKTFIRRRDYLLIQPGLAFANDLLIESDPLVEAGAFVARFMILQSLERLTLPR
ncbi:hypothetical protein [Pseudomonas sp. LRF_L74]|uniref:hypothetical protein n=1 Tax=Pseudomonas sp. LRF_L74 TaxID=3369422 RepID=UPI003F5E2A0B